MCTFVGSEEGHILTILFHEYDLVARSGLFDPTFDFVCFKLELGDCFDGVAGDADFCVIPAEFLGEPGCASECAVAFSIETDRDAFDGACKDGV